MTLPTLGDTLAKARGYLEGRGVRSPRLDAEHLLGHALGMTRLELYLQHDRPLEPAEVDRYRELIARRGRREPLAYILGSWGFRGLDLRCDPRALVPRPETEVLVDAALALVAGRATPTLLDVGTGTGAVALALAQELPEADVTATDVSPDALDLARENGVRNELEGRVEWLEGDLLAPVAGRAFDLVCANLPYVGVEDEVDEEVARYEPAVAVYAPDGGRGVLARLVAEVPAHVAPDGALALEVGEGQPVWLLELLAAGGWREPRAERDLQGVERVVVAHAPA